MILHEIPASIAKKPYICVFFGGGGGGWGPDTLFPFRSAHELWSAIVVAPIVC